MPMPPPLPPLPLLPLTPPPLHLSHPPLLTLTLPSFPPAALLQSHTPQPPSTTPPLLLFPPPTPPPKPHLWIRKVFLFFLFGRSERWGM
ncbi:unnamed protein product [Periconia digitata]|uniref:Uncharacterized protein n=1 Tax=Periconia digitata TaxID=1303443 RepID=A0A9W4U4M7_9PLEO|nr:unnamed protein product [Periconia digitata]